MRALAPAAAALLVLAAILSLDPIAQDPHYHAFADVRTRFGVPNFFNVISNLPFLLVGVAGVVSCRHRRSGGAIHAWTIFFGAVALVGFGSSYYHLGPTSATLVWDRLPITVAFMALLVGLLSEHVDARLERYLLVPALVVGIASVAWWLYADYLRFYVWVQLAPLLVLPLALWLFPPNYTHRRCLLYGLACYAAAKIAELYDGRIYAWTGDGVSGHSLKHLLACAGAVCIYAMLRRRRAGTLPTAAVQHAR